MHSFTALALSAALLGGMPSADFAPGAAGAGDPYFPMAGNGGYQPTHYDLAIRYSPSAKSLSGTATLNAWAIKDLSRFDLDLVGLTVDQVQVYDHPAAFQRHGQKLVITPGAGMHVGDDFTVRVRYHGSPKTLDDPGLGRTGWLYTPDGAVTLSQPLGSATWFPVDDHPSFKATYTYHVTVPKGLQVLANGLPQGRHANHDGTVTHNWRTDRPMADYLAMVAIGKFSVRTGRTHTGVPEIVAAPRPADADALLKLTTAATDWETGLFGRYPFASTGGVEDEAPGVDYALETQTRPVYGFHPDQSIVVHELAHQWFGDSVSLAKWQDIWLNEGFATYAEWLWDEQHGGGSAQSHFTEAYAAPADSPVWQTPPGDPGRDHLFDGFPIYTRGAMTLQVLRNTVGDKAFFRILREWAARHRDGSGSTGDFRSLAEEVSGRQLGTLFDRWLYGTSKPAL